LGVLDGVIATRPGWLEKLEVVEVEYDPARLPFPRLVALAESRDCALRVFARTDAQQAAAQRLVGTRATRSDAAIRVDDDKYYASRTALRHLPMTALQAARVNARVGKKEAVRDLLSPRQRALLARIEAAPQEDWPVAIGVGIAAAWAKVAGR
jgi:hypothetical protein